MTAIAFVVLAGTGALVRWQTSARYGPAATLAVNIAGAFALAVLHASGEVPTAIAAGGLGALTTVSSVAGQVAAAEARHRGTGAAYAALTLITGISAAWLGLQLG